MKTIASDKYHNRIYTKKIRGAEGVYLYLAERNETRTLGRIQSLREKKLIIDRIPSAHIFQKLNAYGFNAVLIRTLKPETRVYIKEK